MDKRAIDAINAAKERVREAQRAQCAKLPELRRRLAETLDVREREWVESEILAAESACEACGEDPSA